MAHTITRRLGLLMTAILALGPARAFEADDFPYPGARVIKTPYGFSELAARVATAVTGNGMFVVNRASASAGAKGRGIDIPGNMVIGIYRNDFAVRMLAASIPAGIEAPLRFYLSENADGTATLSYRAPSAVFKPYGSAELDAMAKELDDIFARIAAQAAER